DRRIGSATNLALARMRAQGREEESRRCIEARGFARVWAFWPFWLRLACRSRAVALLALATVPATGGSAGLRRPAAQAATTFAPSARRTRAAQRSRRAMQRAWLHTRLTTTACTQVMERGLASARRNARIVWSRRTRALRHSSIVFPR